MLQRTDWSPDYREIFIERRKRLAKLRSDPDKYIPGMRGYYRTRPVEFVEDWCFTVDPRNSGQAGKLVRMPFILFPRQRDLIEFFQDCIRQERGGLIEKSRDMGATWVAVAFSVWLFLFWPGASVGWGSRKEMLVDRLGDMDSIFEKIRALLRSLPAEILPAGFSDKQFTHMKVINPENGASITGESGDNIGRGGRKLVYFVDEAAHLEHPESVEAALADNTRVQIAISSVAGFGNLFHRRREAGVDWHPGTQAPAGRTLVFVMDWSDHPHKTQAWYDARKEAAREDGVYHLFAQEVERNYSAAVIGTIIPADHVQAAIDAHLKLKMPEMESGGWCAALDVADNDSKNGDRNALAKRKGVVLRYLDEWGLVDGGETTRRTVAACQPHAPMDIQYDCIGVGSSVKAESNRLREARLLPRGLKFVPWSAADEPIGKEERLLIHADGGRDEDSPLVGDFYGNLKAQAWWELRIRFERTFRAVTQGTQYPPEELISLPSVLPRLRQLQKELSQPVSKKHVGNMKLIVDKTPEGTRSPNLADAVVMCYWPANQSAYDSDLNWVG